MIFFFSWNKFIYEDSSSEKIKLASIHYSGKNQYTWTSSLNCWWCFASSEHIPSMCDNCCFAVRQDYIMLSLSKCLSVNCQHDGAKMSFLNILSCLLTYNDYKCSQNVRNPAPQFSGWSLFMKCVTTEARTLKSYKFCSWNWLVVEDGKMEGLKTGTDGFLFGLGFESV